MQTTMATCHDDAMTRADDTNADTVTDRESSDGWQITLLGGVRIVAPDGSPIDPGSAKSQQLLGALALSPDRAVSVDALVDLLWGEDPPRTAAKTLQTYVARVRKALGHDRIARVGNAYRLDLADSQIDVRRFRASLARGDVGAALAEWGGLPLAGLDAPGLRPMVDGLVEEWLAAIETQLDQSVESDPHAAIGQLTELTARHPFREGLWALLMRALYAVGRQAEALAAYRRARDHLVDELGVEPGPVLRALEASILAHDDGLPSARPRQNRAELPAGTVTFACSVIDRSARLWSDHGGRAGEVIARHDEIVRSTAVAHGGHEFVAGGDTFGIAFHRAADAAAWAVELQGAIAGESWPEGIELSVRVGLHTGDAERRSGSYYGSAVNVASRLAAAAHGRQTLVSSVTASLLGGGELRELGVVRLDGVSATLRVHQLGPGEFPELRTVERRRGNLPRPASRLLGRDRLIDAVSAAIATSSVVTLVGPGGIGKTRLALDIARVESRVRTGGGWMVELADVTAGDEVVRAVADVIDANELPGRSLIQSVVSALETQELVVVLDNCEHVVDAVAELASTIAEECPGVRIIATSREGLGIGAEQLMPVGPLDVEGAAVDLFVQRATALDHTFDVATCRSAVEEICRRLDGVPLAIELAAARTRSLTPADIVERLDDSFRLLSSGRRASVERHRTLRTTIRWSHDLLSEPERVLFRRLSVFAGSFDLAAAERVMPGGDLEPDDVDALLGALVERSMVVPESGTFGRRFRLLELMRQFGSEQLAENDLPDRVAQRHARFVADEVSDIARCLASRDEAYGALRLSELWPNLRAAFEWAESQGDIDLAKELVGPIAAQSFVRRGVSEITDWAERVLAMADPADEDTIAFGLLWWSFHHILTHDRAAFDAMDRRYGSPDHLIAQLARVAVLDADDETLAIGEAAVVELRRLGYDHLACLIDVFIGGAIIGQGRLEDAEAHLSDLADQFRRDGPPTFQNWTLFMLGAIADIAGDVELAQRRFDEALAVPVPPSTNTPNDMLLARAQFRRGEHREAFRVLRDHAAEQLRARNRSSAGLIALEFLNMAAAVDRLDMAAQVLAYLDQSGMLDVEGRGFRLLVQESAETVEADPTAAAVRQALAAQSLDDDWVLRTVRDLLEELLTEFEEALDSNSTISPPPVDPTERS